MGQGDRATGPGEDIYRNVTLNLATSQEVYSLHLMTEDLLDLASVDLVQCLLSGHVPVRMNYHLFVQCLAVVIPNYSYTINNDSNFSPLKCPD